MSKREIVGIIFAVISALTLIYIAYGFWEKYPIESLEPYITAFLVSAGIAGLCLITGKSKP
jgi:hypothetical protein